jgi:hypothetical protein
MLCRSVSCPEEGEFGLEQLATGRHSRPHLNLEGGGGREGERIRREGREDTERGERGEEREGRRRW